MHERKQEFFKDLKIDKHDEERAEKAIFSKGIEKHILVKEYLLNLRESNEIRYSEIATTYRYDKRIRNTLFRYIAYFEEFLRGAILDELFNKVNDNNLIKKLKSHYEKQDKDLNKALEKLEFSVLINQMNKMSDATKKKCGFFQENIKKNASALVELRNAVMHNKFLLLFKGFKICFINGKESAGLGENILNLTNFLPREVKEKCLAEIIDCKNEKNNNGKTRWDLPPDVIVEITQQKSEYKPKFNLI